MRSDFVYKILILKYLISNPYQIFKKNINGQDIIM